MLHVTSWVFTDKHHDLFSDRGGVGFPYLAFLDEKGGILAVHRDAQTIEALQASAAAAKKMLERRVEAEAGNIDAVIDVYIQRMRMEGMSFREANSMYAAIADALSVEQDREVRQLLVNREVAHRLNELRRKYPGQRGDFRKEVAMATVQLFQADKVPTNDLARHYFAALFGAAEATKNRKLFAAALSVLESKFGDDPRFARTIERQKAVLADWK